MNETNRIAEDLTGKLAVSKPSTRRQKPLPHLQPRVANLMRSHSNLNDFMVAMNPDVQMSYGKDAKRAILCDAPELVVINQAYGENAAEAWLIPQITDLAKFAGAKDKLDERQYKQLACIIAAEFGYLKATELMLFFYRFKCGWYGKFYGAVDPLDIVTALRVNFLAERAHIIDQHNREQNAKEMEEHRKHAITFEEYMRRKQQQS